MYTNAYMYNCKYIAIYSWLQSLYTQLKLSFINTIDVPIPNNTGSSSDSVAIIGGAVGGVILLLMIIVVLCIVILCMRRSHRKKGFEDEKVTYSTSKLNTDVSMDYNPSYDIIASQPYPYVIYHSYIAITLKLSPVCIILQ